MIEKIKIKVGDKLVVNDVNHPLCEVFEVAVIGRNGEVYDTKWRMLNMHLFRRADKEEIEAGKRLPRLKPIEVVRDAMGFWTHPVLSVYLDNVLADREFITDAEVKAISDHFNVDIVIEGVRLCEVDPTAQGDWSGFEPIPPSQNHFLISTVESENSENAYFWWAKEKQSLMEVS